ncbi:DUF2630 family protein [Nocardioides sp. NPDC004968]|uniref:DUF2630 family protein n=1 Tax=Nocardioides sp. NPDC004968 TaxID=3155894 RepID=UPI0033B0581D
MEDVDVLAGIRGLIAAEHELRQTPAKDEQQVVEIEALLGQCWDLLRQRRARRDFDQDPTTAQARPPSVVESYLQ